MEVVHFRLENDTGAMASSCNQVARLDRIGAEAAMTFPGRAAFETWEDPGQLDPIKLIRLCAEDLEDQELWGEFLRRYTGRIRLFIRGTLRRSATGTASSPGLVPLQGVTESDLIQNVILRLVDNGCAALKRFSGTTEAELLAYFAVIARSAVRDSFRRQKALKRPGHPQNPLIEGRQWEDTLEDGSRSQHPVEREILAHELEQLSLRMIQDHSGAHSDRDRLIFQLYFYDGLSLGQISKCAGIDLSKTGVEKTLDRLKDRVRCAAGGAQSIEAIER